ncbi:MAG: secretin N-terminal domain-containing protein [Candidatus Omnitrophota bacterium]
MRILNSNGWMITKILLISILIFNYPCEVSAQGSPRISMDFQNAELKDVLKVFSQQAGLNFVASDNIEDKKITLYLDDVTVQDALDSIMKANNLIYEQPPESNIFVVKESKEAEIQMVTKVYKLKYARVAATGNVMQEQVVDIRTLLKDMLTKKDGGSSYGSIAVDRRTNSVIITTVAEDFPLIERTINELDSMTPQALIEAEIVEINTSAFQALGLDWGGATGTFVSFTGPVKSTKFPFIRDQGMFKQGLLEGAETANRLGTLSLAEFSVLIKALESEGMARYLAKPRMMVLNNETAEINITSDTAVGIESTTITETGEVIRKAERQETGVSLKVTPTINENDYITMTIEPNVSRPIQSEFFSDFVDPAKRSAKTTVMVKGGQTLAIGGLLKSDDEGSKRKTPGVNKIPFFGNLFKSKEDRSSGTELVIFITAHVIRDVAELGADLIEIDRQKDKGLPKEVEILDAEKQLSDDRESEIKKTVIKLRKKRELSRTTDRTD